MVFIFIQSLSFEYLNLGFEKYSFVINVAILVTIEVHSAIGTHVLAPTPVVYNEIPTANLLTPVKISKIVI